MDKEYLKYSQEAFINNEIWQLTFGGAFQRAGIYKANIDEQEKGFFKIKLRGYVEHLFLSYQEGRMTESIHIENILDLANFTTCFSEILTNGKISIGVAQKILNLYLKYQWSLGKIVEPPHFPVDRIIQQQMGGKIISWTTLDNIDEYKEIIEKARVKSTKEGISLAEWELLYFKRRIDS